MRKSRIETAETRKRIVATASRVFLTKGLAATGIADIMVAGHRPPPDSEFVHQLSGVAEVNFDSGAIKVTSPVWITRSGCWSVIHVASSAQLSEKCGLSWLRCVSEI